MIPIITLSYVIRLLLFVFLFADFSNYHREVNAKKEVGFAVVELFTSEGCSSCPAADEAIIELSKKFPENVYFLGYHVDYWDHLGWKDEYSSKAFTKRQEQYANEFNLNSIYTPQVVVNGKAEFVGSDKNKLEQTIQEELKNKSGITIGLNAKLEGQDKINVTYKTNDLGNGEELNIALIQLMATTQVKRGENHDRELHHINIVRDLKNGYSNSSSVIFKLPPDLTAKDLKIVAFAQNKNDLRINAAAETYLNK
jgi:hypothetical protein